MARTAKLRLRLKLKSGLFPRGDDEAQFSDIISARGSATESDRDC